MDNMIFIKKFSKPLSLLFSVAVVIVPLANASYWFFYNSLPMTGAIILKVNQAVELDVLTRSFLFLVSLFPVMVITFGFYKLAQIFKLYANGIVFSVESVKYYRHLGYIILMWVLVHFLFTPLSSLVIALNHPAAELGIHIGLHPMDAFILLIGFVVIVNSKIMEEARNMNENYTLPASESTS